MPKKQIDVFLCHNSVEKHIVEEIREYLQALGISTWLDKYDLNPSVPWQAQIDELISRVKIVAVCIGSSGIGPSAEIEIRKFIAESRIREIHIGLVVLQGCSNSSINQVPSSVRKVCWIDFRQKGSANMERLSYELLKALDKKTIDSFA